MVVNALCLRAWFQPVGFGIEEILLYQPGRDLGNCTVLLFWFQGAGKLLFFATWDMDYIPESSSSISPYSFPTTELFQAEKPQQPKLIKLITSFLQSMHFCPFLCWFQCLSDPAASWFQCAQLAEKYRGGGGSKQQLPAEFAYWNSSAQNQINTRANTREGAAGVQQPLQLHQFHLHETEASVSPILNL